MSTTITQINPPYTYAFTLFLLYFLQAPHTDAERSTSLRLTSLQVPYVDTKVVQTETGLIAVTAI